jgi:hypothetical protein
MMMMMMMMYGNKKMKPGGFVLMCVWSDMYRISGDKLEQNPTNQIAPSNKLEIRQNCTFVDFESNSLHF